MIVVYRNIWSHIMLSKTAFAALSAAIFSSYLFVIPQTLAAEVTVPASLQILDIDGQPQNAAHTDLQLSNGTHVLVVRYRDLFADSADDSGAWVTSEPLYLNLAIKDQQPVQLHIPVIDNASAAKTYLHQPYLTVGTANGHTDQLPLRTQASVITELLSAQR
jgi:uncharacterized protein YccT (UPF0319 family)